MANTIVWADIPVADMDQGAQVLRGGAARPRCHSWTGPTATSRSCPWSRATVSGDLVQSEHQTPGAPGVTIYLDSKGDPEGMIERAVAAGGQMACR